MLVLVAAQLHYTRHVAGGHLHRSSLLYVDVAGERSTLPGLAVAPGLLLSTLERMMSTPSRFMAAFDFECRDDGILFPTFPPWPKAGFTV